MLAAMAAAPMPFEDRVGAAPAGYLQQLLRRVHGVAGERLLGVWLMGSAALDDFDPVRSDLDVQAVSAAPLSLAERRRLAAALEHGALPCPARGLEFVLYARDDLTAADGPAYGMNLNTGAGMDHRLSFDATADPRFWFVIDLSIARQHAVALAGPSPADAFPPLPDALVRSALRDAMDWYALEGGSVAQTVLSATRTWAWATDGRWLSKGDSANWARERLADPGPVDRALALRGAEAAASGEAPELTDADAAPVLAAARAALDASRARA
jgi:aminoglycoside adenylyltransferase-like protein